MLRQAIRVNEERGRLAMALVEAVHRRPLRREGRGDLRRAIEAAREAMDTRREIAGDLRRAA